MTEQEFRNYLAAGIVCNTLWSGAEEVKKEPEWAKEKHPTPSQSMSKGGTAT